jgi:two-component system NtrC family sensor kinase
MGPLFRPNSLIFKVIFITSLIIVVAISIRVWLNIRLHEASIQRLTYEKTKIISEFIEKNVIRAMEKGRHFEIHRVLQNFATYRGIQKINVFTPDGTIIASTFEEELKKNVGNIDFFLENRNFIREERVLNKDGRREQQRIYYYVNPILNKPECFQCHNQREKIVGILTVANSLKEMDEEVSKVKRDAVVIAIITIGFMSSALGLLFMRIINRPITKLISAMRRAEAGDLNVRVDLKSKDEMGRLGESLNTMIEKLNAAKKEAEQYHQELVQRADRMASIG